MNPPLVLFVCTGNICRSPMAAALFKARVERSGDNVLVESAGTWGLEGEPASALAGVVMAKRGLSLEHHIARTVSRELLERATLVLTMTRSHRDALSAEFPFVRHKIRLLSQVTGLEYDITDPYGKPLDAYQLCADDLEELIERGYPQICEWLAQMPSPVTNA